MGAPDDVLMRAADSIATGDAIDWQGLQQQPLDTEQSRILAEMQILERIATFLRTSDTLDTSAEPRGKGYQGALPGTWAHFTIIEPIGEGGFGSVYRAHDTKLQTDIALKLIELPTDREVRPARALKEARLLARVRHTNVVTVYGADVVDGRVGIWMQLVEGHTLASLLRANGPFGAQEAALIGVDLCRALAAVHAAGLIHGDVKTRNVMREAGGRTVLMDFGAGTDLSALRLHGTRDAVAGTPLYLAPEVFEGEAPSKVTDIYSLGVVLFHLVTGTYPVKGRTQADIEGAHHRGERTCLRDARPDLPHPFVALVERAISVDARERFETAGAFEKALTDFLGQTQRIDQRRRVLSRWTQAALAAAALAAIGLAAFAVERRLTPVEPRTITAQPLAGATTGASPGYRIETALYRRRARADARLRAGDRVAPGDELFMMLHVSAPTYIYIVNEDDKGESFLLFPLPGQAMENPIAAETRVRVPGKGDQEVSWQVTSRGEREHFLIFASPERLQAFEDLFAALPRPVFGKPVLSARIPTGTLLKLRGVGGLTATAGPSNARLANVFTSPLSDAEETARGLWVRQLTVDNPVSTR